MKNVHLPKPGQPRYWLKSSSLLHFLLAFFLVTTTFVLSAQEEEAPCPPRRIAEPIHDIPAVKTRP